MTATAGVGGLLRLTRRTERLPSGVGVLVIPLLLLLTTAALAPLYPDRASRLELASGAASNPVFRVLLGPLQDVSGIGVLSFWRVGMPALLVVAILMAATVTRNLRSAEATGQMELLRSTAVAPTAPVAVAVVVALTSTMVTSVLVGVVATAVGVPVVTALALGGQTACAGAVGTGIAVLVDQVVTTGRTALAASSGILVAAFLLRGVADTADGWSWLAWLSPLGWVERIDPIGRPSVLGVTACVVALAVGVASATAIARRRDLGAGLIRPRPGPGRARWPVLLGMVTVVTIGPVLRPWLGAAFAYCVLVGLLLGSIDSLVGSGGTADLVEKLGRRTDLTDALVNTVLGLVGVVAAAAAVALVGALRADDRAGRGEVVLATAVSPTRRLVATTLLAALAAVVVPVLAACGLTIGRLIASADGPSAGSTVVAALAGVPASLAVASVAVAAYGFGPRWVAVGWIAVVSDLLLGPLGTLLGAPGWLRDLAPHTHLATVVGQPVPVAPVVICLVAATAVTAVGVVALRRRDLT